MNEFLCRNYIAEQIVSEMSLSSVQRRLGSARATVTNEMLQDEGSSAYKNWLSK